MKRFSANAFAILAAMAALVPSVAAQPDLSLTWGAQDSAVAYVASIFATILIVFAPFAGWSFGASMSSTAIGNLRKSAAERFGFLASIHPYVYLIIKLLGQIAIAVVFAGYILHEFADKVTGLPFSGTLETWYVYIVIFVASALRFDMFASETFYRMRMHWLGFGLSLISLLAWVTACVFIFWDIFNLPDTISVNWEIALVAVSLVWVIVSALFTLQYFFLAYSAKSSEGEGLLEEETAPPSRKYR